MASKKEFKKFLSELSKEELVKEIEKLCSKFPLVKTFYDVELSGDTAKLLSEAKRKIENEYFPLRGFGKARSGEVKKIIDDFAKVSIYPKDLIDLYLFRFEMAVKFTNAYGDIDDVFYTSAINVYAKALKLIFHHGYESEFNHRCKLLMEETRNIGWGFSDGVEELYYSHFQDDEDEPQNS
jgi:hypothetical protein